MDILVVSTRLENRSALLRILEGLPVNAFTVSTVQQAHEALLVSRAYGKSDEKRSSELLQEINCRLISAGFKTNLPMYVRHADGHVMMDYPNRAIEILSMAWVN
jgi:hypothetical protein